MRSPATEEIALARAKNTSRSEARRRARMQGRSEIDAASHEEETTAIDPAAVDDRAQPRERRSFLRLPNFREDLRDLPQILTSRRAMVIPPLVLVIGFLLESAVVSGAVPEDYGLPMPLAERGWVSFRDAAILYLDMLFLPPTLLVFFLAGYIAPRASWLVGLLTGLLTTLLWLGVIFGLGRMHGADGVVVIPEEVKGPLATQTAVVSILWGTAGAAFAAWYRDFLRRMRDQGMARRADRDAAERAKRRDQRQADRRSLKSR